MLVFGIEEKYVVSDTPKERVRATKIMFYNQGTQLCYINNMLLLGGDIYKIDIEAPHVLDFEFSIRFVTPSLIVASERLDSGNKLLITTMNVKS